MGRHESHMISYWGNPDYDIALLLCMAAGGVKGDGGGLSAPAQRLEEYVNTHIDADNSKSIGCATFPF